MSNNSFNPINFIIEVSTKDCKQMTWTAEEEGKVFTVAIGKSKIEPKCQSSIPISPNTALDHY